jgi:hypothetical protein
MLLHILTNNLRDSGAPNNKVSIHHKLCLLALFYAYQLPEPIIATLRGVIRIN